MNRSVSRRTAALSALMAAWLMPAAGYAADVAGPGAGMMGESPCYAVFHELPNGRGISIERNGPEAVARIRDLLYSDGGTLNRRVMSVTTGPGAVLKLYDASRFRVPMFEVGPESRVNLAHPVMDSYELHCILPPAPPSYVPPPPGYKQ